MLRLTLLVLLSCGLAGFGIIGWTALSGGAAPAQPAAARKVTVVTLTRALLPGTLLKPEDLASADLDEATLPPGHVLQTGDVQRSLVGGVVRHPLLPGDVLQMPADVLRPSERGFVAAVLAPGTRAVTVAADMISGAAGLVWPGDRVDVVLTQTIDDSGVGPEQRVAARTVLHDVRIIAIDQQIAQSSPAATGASVPNEAPVIAKTVTLEVTPTNGQRLEVAAKLGRLTLALRSANPGPADDAPVAAVWAGDVSAAVPKAAGRPAASSLRVFPGGTDAKEFKF